MNTPLLGPLHPNREIPEWLTSEPIPVPLFDGAKLPFTLDGLEPADEDDVNRAVQAFLSLKAQDRTAAANYVFENYRRIAELVDAAGLACQIQSPAEVWAHVQPSAIYVSRRSRRDRLIYVQITAECDWEPEHGLQIVYRRGSELSYVSEQDGHLTYTDAYDLPESEDRIIRGPSANRKEPGPASKPWWRFW